MDAAAGIGSGGKEGRGGSEMEAFAAEGMAELAKKDHYCYYVRIYGVCTDIRIDHCERLWIVCLVQAHLKPRCKGARGAVR